MQGLTDRQTEIYDFIKDYCKTNGYSPSRKEIATSLNIHTSTLRVYLYSMEKKRVLTWNEKIPRSITILKQLV